jgi:hypothetical protein
VLQQQLGITGGVIVGTEGATPVMPSRASELVDPVEQRVDRGDRSQVTFGRSATSRAGGVVVATRP